RDGNQAQDQRGHDQPDRQFERADAQVDGSLIVLIVTLETQYQHAERLEEETPHHAEGVSLSEEVYVAAARHDRAELQQRDQVDDAMGGPETPVRLPEPVEENAVLGQPVHYAVGADDGSIHRAGENQHADDHDKDVEQQPQHGRSGEMRSQAAQQVVDVLAADRIRNNHPREQRDETRAEHGVNTNNVAGILEILQFGVGDLAIYLSQCLEAAHGKETVAEGDQDRDGSDLRPDGAAQPPESVLTEFQVARQGHRRDLHVAAKQNSERAPDQERDHHHGSDLHDPQRLAARF